VATAAAALGAASGDDQAEAAGAVRDGRRSASAGSGAGGGGDGLSSLVRSLTLLAGTSVING